MDRRFNQPAGQSQSTMSPTTPSSYQVNVNRTKTRKWVEAKVQSYDGDDWGAPESDEEPDSPPPPPQAQAPKPVSERRLPSETRVPGAGRPGHAAAGSIASTPSMSSGGQPLHVQTQQPPAMNVVSPPSAGPLASRGSSPGGSQRTSSEAPANQSQPFTRPADLYRRMEEQNQQGRGSDSPKPSMESAGSEPKGNRLSVSPQLPDVARMSTFGVDLFSNDLSNKRFSGAPALEEEREPSPALSGKEVPGRGSTSATGPTQPPTSLSPPTPSGAPTADPEKTMEPQGGVPIILPHRNVDEAEVSPISEHGGSGSRGFPGSSGAPSSQGSQSNLRPGADARSLPPLRTPSPHEPRTVPPPVAGTLSQPISPEKPPTEITPTEPLQPKKPEASPSDYEPQPLDRQLTLDTTTSSPVKESDVLSEEILRTLTPGSGLASPYNKPNPNQNSLSPGGQPTGRESSYTLSGYDDYWADTADKQDPDTQRKSTAPGALEDVPEHPPIPTIVAPEAQPPVSPDSVLSPGALRRKFSWEAPEAEPPKPNPAVSPQSTVSPVIQPQQTVQSPGSVTNENSQAANSQGPMSPVINVVPDSGSMSHQVSKASTAQPGAAKPSSLGPPSPVSEPSDRDATPLAQPQEPQFPSTEGGMATPLASHPTSPAMASTSPTASGPAGKQIMTFREIMNISGPAERISKYNETRDVFATMESGLENWLETMRHEYPEHAHATSSFSGGPEVAPPSAGNGSGAGQQQSAQQPYYQQYLNANANAPASNTGSARSRLAGIPMQAQAAAGSAFGHSHNQIGHKGKEFMQSAGKMGKGLFSKGKSKLRGTGDKADSSPPPVDRKPQKTDRRMSWALSLGPKSRTDGPTPHATAPITTAKPVQPAEPPKLADPGRMSPLLSQDSPTTKKVFWQQPQGSEDEVAHGPSVQQTDESLGKPGAPVDQRNVPHTIDQDPSIPDDWVVVPRQLAQARGTADPEQNVASAQKVAPTTVPQDSGVGMSSQPESRPDAKRISSFKGLPPIRRNSSFGLSSMTAGTTTADDDSAENNNGPTPTQNGAINTSAAPTSQPGATLSPTEGATNKSVGVDSNATLIGQDSTSQTRRESLNKEPMRHDQPPGAPLQLNTSTSPQSQGQGPLGPMGQPGATNPIQRLPPSGWQLEESHLSEPLHESRRRAGTGSSHQQAVSYGFDKETGGHASMTMSPTSPALGPQPQPQPPRGRLPDVPPSSARRYPDLFRPAGQKPQQRGRANSSGQPVGPHEHYAPRASDDKAQEAGFEASPAPSDERGRRKSSNIFKGIGDRFNMVVKERRASLADQQSEHSKPSTDAPRDANVPGEEGGEPKKRRASFLPALRSSTSFDVVSQRRGSSSRPHTQENSQAGDAASQTQSERKKSSFFGTAADKMAAAQHKFIPGGITRSSTSSPASNDHNNGNGNGNGNSPMGPPKKRFSDLAGKAAGFAGRFQRPGQEGRQTPSQSSTSVTGGHSQDPTASQASLDPPPAPGSDTQERRGRRGSFSGMFTKVISSRSSSKVRGQNEEEVPVSQGPQPQGQVPQPIPSAEGSSPRSSRHLSSQFMQPPRPSPLAQESSITDRESPVRSANYSTQSPASGSPAHVTAASTPVPGEVKGEQTSRTGTPKPTQSSDLPLQASQDANPVVTEVQVGKEGPAPVVAHSTTSTPIGTPTSPVKRQPTPHATALLASQLSPSEPQPPVPSLHSRGPSASESIPREAHLAGPSGHARTDSGASTNRKPLPQTTWIASGENTPTSQPPRQSPRPENHMQTHAPPQQPYPQAGGQYPTPLPPKNGPGGPASRPLNQPPQQNLQGPGQVQTTGGRPAAAQQSSAAPAQPIFNQQALPAQNQPQSSQPENASRWKGLKNRVSSGMAQVAAQSSQDKPPKEGKSGRESWKDKVSQFAPKPNQSGQEKQEKPERGSWKDRVSGQLAQVAPPSHNKPNKGDKTSAGDKMLGAFKRLKANEGTPPPPPPKQGQPGQPVQQQWRPSPMQQGPPPQQFAGQPPHGYYQQQGQIPPQMHPAQYQQYQHAQWANASVAPQHPQHPQHHQQWAYGQQMAAHHQQQQGHRPPEPQYDRVPIPQGYNPVRAEEAVASSNYQVGRQMSPPPSTQYYSGQYPYNPQQAYYPQSLSPPPGQYPAGQTRSVSSPPPAAGPQGMMQPPPQQQQQFAGPRRPSSTSPGEGGFNLPIQGNTTPGEHMPTQSDVTPDEGGPLLPPQRPAAMRTESAFSEAARSVESGALGYMATSGTNQRQLPPGHPQNNHHLQPQASMASMNGQHLSREGSQMSSHHGAVNQPSRPVSVTPEAALEGKGDLIRTPPQANSKPRSEDDIYDATPRLKQDQTGGSHPISEVSKSHTGESTKPGQPAAKPDESNQQHVELEDTADARMRTMRLDSQEEKIFYDPEGDIPKMSATSYPGQEWNPYGEPEFADWRDD